MFISNGFYFLYENNSSKNEIEKGQLEDLKSIANENAIAYIDGEHFNLIPQSVFEESSIESSPSSAATASSVSKESSSISAILIPYWVRHH